MSFMIILLLVIIALVVLSILFAIFKFMFALLPAAIIIAFIFWIIYRLDQNKKRKTDFSSSSNKTSAATKLDSSEKARRMPARDVEVKDVEDEDKGNG